MIRLITHLPEGNARLIQPKPEPPPEGRDPIQILYTDSRRVTLDIDRMYAGSPIRRVKKKKKPVKAFRAVFSAAHRGGR